MALPETWTPPPEAFMTVQDEEQARLLSDVKSFNYFIPFVAKERTVSEAAREVGCTLEAMLYRVNQFCKAGLLEVTRLKKRAGRSVKLYRSVAEAFFVPFHLTPFADLEERLAGTMLANQQQLLSALANTLKLQQAYGQRIYRAPDGEVWKSSAETETASGDLDLHIGTQMHSDMYLTDEEARAFQRALRDLWLEYHRGPDEAEGRSLFALSFAFAKLEPK